MRINCEAFDEYNVINTRIGPMITDPNNESIYSDNHVKFFEDFGILL